MPDKLQIDDLKRIYIRAQDETGKWVSVSCYEATDAQFDKWASSCPEVIHIPWDEKLLGSEPEPKAEIWLLEERVDFCTWLNQRRPLYMVKDE
jgi:hypothetical protein